MTNYHATFVPDGCYHIYNRGNNKENIFKREDNYRYFLQKWKQYIAPHTRTLAWVLMPNHFHFLIWVKPEAAFADSISAAQQSLWEKKQHDVNAFLEERFQRLFAGYTHAINRQENRTGSLFQKRFRRIAIQKEAQLTNLVHYVHHNPVHHGYTTAYEDWGYSSYGAFLSHKPTQVERDWVLEWFGGKDAFIAFHQVQLSGKRIADMEDSDKA